METDAVPEVRAPSTASRLSRIRRLAGTMMIVVGAALLVWCLVVWRWNDPFTAMYTRWEQRKLETRYAEILHAERARPLVPPRSTRPSVAALESAVADAARRFRQHAVEGSPIGHIVVPRIGLDMVMVNGTEADTLRKGPGRDLRTYMPGEGELVYVAGHRTTYLAPFAHIDRLESGDAVTLEMPYATFRYRVTRHQIVEADDLSVLESHGREVVALQACHPRFFATHRYIVWATPVLVTPRGGRTYRPDADRVATAGDAKPRASAPRASSTS
jgi:sortase A